MAGFLNPYPQIYEKSFNGLAKNLKDLARNLSKYG